MTSDCKLLVWGFGPSYFIFELAGAWHPVSRWTDTLNKFFRQIHGERMAAIGGNSFWMALAEDRVPWASLTEDYVNFATVDKVVIF